MKEKAQKMFRNKYVIVSLCFFVYILALEETDLITLTGYKLKVHELEQQEEYYQAELKSTQESLTELTTDDAALERFAREKHFMKRSSEDVFVFVEKE